MICSEILKVKSQPLLVFYQWKSQNILGSISMRKFQPLQNCNVYIFESSILMKSNSRNLSFCVKLMYLLLSYIFLSARLASASASISPLKPIFLCLSFAFCCNVWDQTSTPFLYVCVLLFAAICWTKPQFHFLPLAVCCNLSDQS